MKKQNKLPLNIKAKIETGVYSSFATTNFDFAKEAADELVDYIERNMIEKPKGLLNHFKFMLNQAINGILIYSFWYSFHATLLYFGFHFWFPLTWLQCLGIFITLRMLKAGFINLPTNLHHKKNEDTNYPGGGDS